MLQTYQRTIHQKMLMSFLYTISMQSIGTPSQTIITVFQTIFKTVVQIRQRKDFKVSDNTANNKTSSNGDDTLSNMNSMDIDDMLPKVRKVNKECISYISTEHSMAPSIPFTTELEV